MRDFIGKPMTQDLKKEILAQIHALFNERRLRENLPELSIEATEETPGTITFNALDLFTLLMLQGVEVKKIPPWVFGHKGFGSVIIDGFTYVHVPATYDDLGNVFTKVENHIILPKIHIDL